MIDINELRRLAQAATPGPWKMLPVGDGRQKFAVADSEFLSILTVTDEGGATFGTVYDDADAKFMTAANPASISELLDRLEAAESDALEQARLNGMGGEREAALLAKLEAAEKERDHEKWLRERAKDYAKAVEEQREALRADKATLQQMTYSLKDRLEAAEKDRDTLHAHRTTLQHMVYSLKDQLKGAGKELDTCKAALEEWHQKTGWVQQGINDGSIPPTYLGWHRADVMADMLKSAGRDYCVLESHYTALADELAFAKKEIANLHDDISEWMDKCDNLRAKIEQMEKQEPVAQVGVHKTGGNAGIAWSARPLNDFDSLPLLREGDRLYLAPGAQSAPSVPDDGFKRAVMEIKDVGYGAIFKHLICERAAELAAAPEAKP